MSNKELAVKLYIAALQSSATVFSNPKYTGVVKQPTTDDMVQAVADLTEKLSHIPDI